MKSVSVLSHTDRLSWSRVAMVWRFYLPRFRTILWLYPLVSAILLIVSHLSVESWGIFATTPMGLLSFMATLAPLAFASRPDGEMSVTLPALAPEKAVVIFGLSFGIIPLIVYGPVFLINALMGWDCLITALPEKIEGAFHLSTVRISNFTTGCAQIATCLCMVTVLDRHRALFGAIATIGLNFVLGIAGGIWGLIMALRFTGQPPEEVGRAIIADFMDSFLIAMSIVMAIYAIVIICVTARSIKNKQL